MKIIFLDIDGVLNSAAYLKRWRDETFRHEKGEKKGDRWIEMIDELAVPLLNKIIEVTGAKVVISSTWRILNSAEMIQTYLNKKGFVGEIIGCTPRLPFDDRGTEIERWLKTHDPVESFVILDDGSDMGPVLDRLVHTTWATGLQQEHVERAIELLSE